MAGEEKYYPESRGLHYVLQRSDQCFFDANTMLTYKGISPAIDFAQTDSASLLKHH